MKLRRLEIRALAGVEPGFTLEDPGTGLNVVTGPNGSGKSSLCRAVRAVLGPLAPDVSGAPVHVVAEFDDGASTLRAVRVGSQLAWERDGEPLEHGPPLPEPRFLGCFTIDGDALAPDREDTDAEIGVRLVRELDGGYDLAAIRELFAVRPRRAGADRAALRKAEVALAEERARHERVGRDEAGLAALRAALADANAAAEEAERCALAGRLLEARAAHAAARSALEAYPEGMERLAGDERERLDELDRRERALTGRRIQAEGDEREARETLAHQAGLGIDAADLGAAERELAAFEEHDRSRESDARSMSETRAVLADAARALGAEPPGAGLCIDREAVARAEAALDIKRSTDARRAAAQALLDALPAPREVEDPDRLREHRRELGRWLSAPGPWALTLAWLLAPVLLSLGAVAALHARALDLAGQALLGSAVVLSGAALVVSFRAFRAGELRSRVQARLGGEVDPGPDGWEPRGVRRALEAVDAALRDALEAQREQARRIEAEARLTAAERQVAAVCQEIGAGGTALGFDPLRLDASAPRWLALVARWDDARSSAARARAALLRRDEERQGRAARLGAFLARAGEAAPQACADASAFAASVARVRERLAVRDGAARSRVEATRELERIAAELDAVHRSRAALLTRAGIDAGEAGARDLDERLARLSAWREAQAEARDRQAVERECVGALAERGAPQAWLGEALAAGAADVLAARRERALGRARDRDAHAREIGRIETEVAAASRGDVLARARAAVDTARGALGETRTALLEAEAGRAIVDLVERDHVATTRPEVLSRASALFERFTRHRYSLSFEPRAGRFTAHDNEAGTTRALDTLSNGTRMQLLLAVRLAFAREVEPGSPMPLFLDEALATADPQRHRAVAESVAAIVADEGRQVFYLSAQPEDVGFWTDLVGPALRVHDLTSIRHAGRVVTAGSTLAPARPPEVPEPQGADVAAYAAAIGALRDDPWLAPGTVHPVHLLHDDLPLVRRLLAAGAASAGALGVLLDSDAAPLHLDAAEITRLRGRLRVLEAHRLAWREGRGRPLTRAALAEAPAIGIAFIDAAGELVDASGGDAAAFLAALEKGALKRFRRSKLDALRDWLYEHRYLDRRPVLDAFQRALRVEGLVRDAIASGKTSAAEVREVTGWLDAASAIGVSAR